MNIYRGCISAETGLLNYPKILTLCKIGNNSKLSKLPFIKNHTSKLILHCGNFGSGLVVKKNLSDRRGPPYCRHNPDCFSDMLSFSLAAYTRPYNVHKQIHNRSHKVNGLWLPHSRKDPASTSLENSGETYIRPVFQKQLQTLDDFF